MRKQPAGANTSAPSITVLSVSPHDDDHKSLDAIIRQTRWSLLTAADLGAARAILKLQNIPVILCECELNPGTWMDLLEYTQGMATPPSVIVTSRLADERLWSIALNRNAWDVLAKPYNRQEVLRSIKCAWDHWHYSTATPVRMSAIAQAS